MSPSEIARRIINGRSLSEPDIQIINAFAFVSVMRINAQQAALEAEDDVSLSDALELERKYATEMRQWADKRKDLFGSEQVIQAPVTDDEEELLKQEKILQFKRKGS